MAVEEAGARSRESRLIAHLFDHRDRRTSLVAPYWVTQGGIAERTGIAQPNVSPLLGQLAARGLVTSRMSYVEGSRRPRQVYFLSEAGEDAARTLLRSERVRANYPSSLPRPRAFIGRARELRAVREWLTAAGSRPLYLHGIAGIGKTTLLLESLRDASASASVFYFQIRDWTSFSHLLRELAWWLNLHSRADLKGYLDSCAAMGTLPDVGISISHLLRDLEVLDTVITLDDFQAASRELAGLVAGLMGAAGGRGTRLLVAAREILPPFDRGAIASGTVAALNLSGLDQGEVMALMAQKSPASRVSEEDARRVLQVTGGNPLFVELLREPADLGRPSTLRDYLQREVAGRMSEPERRVVSRLCAFRQSVPLSAFSRPEELPVVDGLLDRSLVIRLEGSDSPERYHMHDTLRSYFHHGLGSDERARAHTAAAGFYSTSGRPVDTVEYLWHLHQLGESKALVDGLLGSAEQLIHSGYPQDLRSILDEVSARTGHAGLMRLKGVCLAALGEAQRAVETFEEALRAGPDPADRPKLCMELANCLVTLGDPDRAEKACRQGLISAREIADPSARQLIRVRLGRTLGLVMIHRLRYQDAIHHLSRCQRAVARLDNPREKALTLDTMGTAYRAMGRFEQALRYHNLALEIYRTVGDPRSIGRTTMSIGLVQYSLGMWERALGSLGEALRTAERFRDGEPVLVATIRIGSLLAERGQHDLAEPYLRRGFELAREVRNRGQSVMAGVALSQLEVMRGHQEKAIEWLAEAQRLADGLNNIYLRWLVAISRARVEAHAGRVDRCVATLQPWRKVAADLGSDELLAAIHGVLARAYHQGGRPTEARRSVIKALRIHSRRSSPSFDMAQALELAGLVHRALGEAGQSRNAMERALALYEHFGFSLGAERCRRALVA